MLRLKPEHLEIFMAKNKVVPAPKGKIAPAPKGKVAPAKKK